MSSNAGIFMGAVFAMGDGATPEIFTDLAEVFEATLPEETIDSIEVTHFGSPDQTREFIPGLRDPGEISITANFTEAGYAALKAAAAARKTRNYKFTMPLLGEQTTKGSTLTVTAFPTSVGSSDPMDGKRTVSAKFKLSGQPTYVAGA
jgi:hypothetical protein